MMSPLQRMVQFSMRLLQYEESHLINAPSESPAIAPTTVPSLTPVRPGSHKQ